jgi:hypothetical protein
VTHAEINSAVRALAYLKTPDKVRAGIRNTYGFEVPVERVARALSTISEKRPVRNIQLEPLASDAFDYDYRVNPNVRPQIIEPIKPRTAPVFKQREPLPAEVPAPSPTNPYEGPFEFKRLVASIGTDFSVTADEIIGKGRFRKLILPRLVLTKLCLERGMSLIQIGRRMGGRDHTTILHQRDIFDAYAARYPQVRASYVRHVALREEARGVAA